MGGLSPAPAIVSPCTGVCRIDPANACCEGCARTLDEIARWAMMTPVERERVMRKLPLRIESVTPTPVCPE